MKCPHCGHAEDHVIDSRPVETASVIRRRRECLQCERRFTTYERVDAMPLMVIKSDNRREPYSREKLRTGIARACKKRGIGAERIEELVTTVESDLQEEFVLEVPTRFIGEKALNRLKELDAVAYIRFASVYKQFSDIDSFFSELNALQRDLKPAAKTASPEKSGSLAIHPSRN